MSKPNQPILRTERLELRPLGPEHFELTRQLDFDPDVMRYVLTGKPLTPEQAVEVHQWLMDSAKPILGLGCWVGFIGQDFVGWWVLAPSASRQQTNAKKEEGDEEEPSPTDEKYNPDRAEFGWRLLPKFWRRGLAKEGSRELLRYAFQNLQLKEVVGDTMTVNVASRATMVSCGLQHVRTFYNTYDGVDPIPGIEEGEVEYRITRDEWWSAFTSSQQQPVVHVHPQSTTTVG